MLHDAPGTTRRHPVPSGTTKQTRTTLHYSARSGTTQQQSVPLSPTRRQPMPPSDKTQHYLAKPGAIWHHQVLTPPPGAICTPRCKKLIISTPSWHHPAPPRATRHYPAPHGTTRYHFALPDATSHHPSILKLPPPPPG